MEQQNANQQPQDYILSLYEVCEILGKSSRTVSRYVHRNILHPVGIKSRQGTLEYRFSRAEVEVLKQREDEIRQFNYMTQLPNTRPGMATFASVNYQPQQTMPRNQFTIPGISFPQSQAPSNQPGEPIQSRQKEPEPVVAPSDNSNNRRDSMAGEASAPAASHNESLSEQAPFQDHSNEQIIILLKETTEMLRDQLQVKDGQIKNLDEKIGQLIERNRETNILLKGLQDKMVLLDKPKNERKVQARPEAASVNGEDAAPVSSPAPRVVDAVTNQVKLKIAREGDELASQDNGQAVNHSEIQGRVMVKSVRNEPQEAPQRNESQASKGFFGKIFG